MIIRVGVIQCLFARIFFFALFRGFLKFVSGTEKIHLRAAVAVLNHPEIALKSKLIYVKRYRMEISEKSSFRRRAFI